MSTHETLPQTYFDDVYAAHTDPWSFETSAYERAKHTATLAALPKQKFDRVFEIGCSIGVLTAMLAPRCKTLLAVDISEAALQAARQRLVNDSHVLLQKMAVPHEFPSGHFDLVLMSEVGYYWSPPDLALASQRIVSALQPGATLILVHWTPVVDDYPLTGDAVHAHFLQLSGANAPLRHLAAQRESTYRLDTFERTVEVPS